jgi:hypothetical protein
MSSTPSPEDNGPDESNTFPKPCRNCGHPVQPNDGRLCSNCGVPLDIVPTWPPPPRGGDPVVPKSENRNDSGTGTGLGCLNVIIGMFIFGEVVNLVSKLTTSLARVLIPAIVTLAMQAGTYYWLKQRRKLMARSMGFVLLISWAIALGLWTVCYGTTGI